MYTYNSVADEIIGALQRPFDVQFRKRVKAALRHTFAELIRQQIMKNGDTFFFTTPYNVQLEECDVDACGNECEDGCWVSTAKLPTPIRTGSEVPLQFVGPSNHSVSYMFTYPYEKPYADTTEVFQDHPPRWYLEDGYLKVCGIEYDEDEDQIRQGIPPPDPGEEPILCLKVIGVHNMGDIYSDDDNLYFDDDTVLPIPEDLIQTAKLKLLEGELSITDNKVAPELTHIDNE